MSQILYRMHSASLAGYQQGWRGLGVLVPQKSLLQANQPLPPLLQQPRAMVMLLRDELLIKLIKLNILLS